jgi:hypothetical protein
MMSIIPFYIFPFFREIEEIWIHNKYYKNNRINLIGHEMNEHTIAYQLCMATRSCFENRSTSCPSMALSFLMEKPPSPHFHNCPCMSSQQA